MRTIRELAVEADLGLSQYQLRDWFDGCQLKSDVLLVTDRKQGEDIARLFGEKLRRALPHLKIMVQPPKPEPVKFKSSIWKKGAPHTQGDML